MIIRYLYLPHNKIVIILLKMLRGQVAHHRKTLCSVIVFLYEEDYSLLHRE